MAEDLLDDRIAGRHPAGDREMADGGAGQTQEAESAPELPKANNSSSDSDNVVTLDAFRKK